ncbi:MAG: hypothetical protein VW518_00490 [Burkholderiaceae bacterium]
MIIQWASMLLEYDYKDICNLVKFPAYGISTYDFYEQDNIIFINEGVVDDLNQPGDTIGKRRLQTPHKLYRLNYIVYNFIELMKADRRLFIDTNGVIFEYIRTKWVRVPSFKIWKKQSRNTYSVIHLKGITNIYKVPRYPYAEEWAQVIMLDGNPWRLYSLSEEELDTLKRKI